MPTLRKRTHGIVHRHAIKVAKAAAAKQQWHARMVYEIGKEVLRDERFAHLGGCLQKLSHWGWNEENTLHEQIEKDDRLVDLAEELNIEPETLVKAILFAAYIDQEYAGSFEQYWKEVGGIWFQNELSRLKPLGPEDEEAAPQAAW